MATLASKTRLKAVQINGQTIAVELRETVLQAALRSGIDFPNSCRVGGCGTCKCRLVSGKVKELTETGYLLSQQEIDQGYILACQSVPKSDLSIQVDLAGRLQTRTGRVIAQDKLTHDITHLTVQLDQPLDYKAGQFADVSLEGLADTTRSYSFATPTSADGKVSFFVRKVPGGRFSPLVHDEQVLGRTLTLKGPSGEFYERDSAAPALCIAGGSGLAPILAILKDMAARGSERSVTLLFGAREERDLYQLDELEALERSWKGKFKFVPVLSHLTSDAPWTGERGWVTDKIPTLLEKGAHAYLCGPPQMIDRAIEQLETHGVRREHIHLDRFTTQADVANLANQAAQPDAEQTDSRSAGFLDYAKSTVFHVIALIAMFAMFFGGHSLSWIVAGVAAFYVFGDLAFGEDHSTPHFGKPWILTWLLWAALPLLALIIFEATWYVSPGDALGLGAFVQHLSDVDVVAAKNAATIGDKIGVFIAAGLMIGFLGTITAHELTHRTWDPISMFVGRWLLAFSFDTIFAIEHVYGHHRYVSTLEDPATAPRGRNIYYHVVASTIKGNISAWKIEAERLRKKRLPVFSHHNAFIRGHLMSTLLVLGAYLMGGLWTMLFFIGFSLWGKSLLEIVNYMEHYGLVRNPETPVQPRHSWNTTRLLSSWAMFNLTRHSHHHAQGEVPFYELRPYTDAPKMIGGYLTTIIVALIPPLWHKLMTPKVLAWDREFATEEERKLAAIANERSGMKAFREANRTSQVASPGLKAVA